MKPNDKYHVCCGQRIRARVIDGKLVEQEHKCQDAKDVAGIAWKALHDQFGSYYRAQITANAAVVSAPPAILSVEEKAAELMRQGVSIEDALDRARTIANAGSA